MKFLSSMELLSSIELQSGENGRGHNVNLIKLSDNQGLELFPTVAAAPVITSVCEQSASDDLLVFSYK